MVRRQVDDYCLPLQKITEGLSEIKRRGTRARLARRSRCSYLYTPPLEIDSASVVFHFKSASQSSRSPPAIVFAQAMIDLTNSQLKSKMFSQITLKP